MSNFEFRTEGIRDVLRVPEEHGWELLSLFGMGRPLDLDIPGLESPERTSGDLRSNQVRDLASRHLFSLTGRPPIQWSDDLSTDFDENMRKLRSLADRSRKTGVITYTISSDQGDPNL